MGNKEQELDLSLLDEAFGIEYSNIPDGERPHVEIEEIEIDYNDPEDILKGNIKKANIILDKIQEEIANGNFTARMVEVAGNIINSITAASKEIITDKNYKQYLKIRDGLKKLKEREVVIKERIGGRTSTTNQNIIVTSREDLLKIMGSPEQEPIKIGEGNIKQIEEKN
jgi:hypothetical protein